MDSIFTRVRKTTVPRKKKHDSLGAGAKLICDQKSQKPKVPKAHSERESSVQSLIIAWLMTNKVFCWRCNTVGIWDTNTQRYRALTGVGAMKGVADVLGILKDGRFLAIEVKSASGTVSKEQSEFIGNINANGGIAFVARSLDKVKEKLNGLI